MLSFSRILVVAALAVSALAAPEPTHTSVDSVAHINPVGLVTRSLPQKPSVHLTNAQRLARGLPPNRPRARYGRRGGQALQPRQSSTSVVRTGYIQASIANYGNGYVSKDTNVFGEYTYTSDISNALSLSFTTDSTGSTFDISALNGVSGFDYLGFSTGYGNVGDERTMQAGSYNYAYVVAVPQEPRGPAVQSPNSYSGATGLPADVESNVWMIGVTNDLNPSWVNSDGSVATTSTFYVPGDGTFVITGDAEAFASMFGATAINAATFTFVPS